MVLARPLLAALVLVGACTGTRYVPFEEVAEGTPSPFRAVALDLRPAYFEAYPDCVAVMPPVARRGVGGRLPGLVEASLALYLGRKISRVVGGDERDRRARDLVLDPVHPEDRRALLRALDCDTLLEADILGPGRTHLLFWTRMRIGLEVRLLSAGDGTLLWRARHVADRSEGGLPLSPINAAADAILSTRFALDPDVEDSVVGDAVRRIVATLPDARRPKR